MKQALSDTSRLPFRWEAPAAPAQQGGRFPLFDEYYLTYYHTYMLSKTGAALAVILFALTACGTKKVSTPEEIQQRQQEIVKEIEEKYGFSDAFISVTSDGKQVPPVIKDGEITEQEVSVQLGIRRVGDNAKKTCYAVVVWRLNSPPDLILNSDTKELLQAETNIGKVALDPRFTDCFNP